MRIGFANGCFDTFHEGHQHFLAECMQRCSWLIVAVNSDVSVRRLKGDSRPHNNAAYRMLRVHKYADSVIPFDGYEEGLIVNIKPDIVFRGYDQGALQLAKGTTCAIVQISQLNGFSTTRILNEAKRDAQDGP